MDQYIEAATKLYQYLDAKHWDGQALIGPDPGVRFNYRIGRFVKNYMPRVKWADDLSYMQAQGYWVLDNWLLYQRTCKQTYREHALRCSNYIRAQQRHDGAWTYPNPAWKGRIATVEGIWGSLGLLESYRQTADPEVLAAVLHWHSFLVHTIGFQRNGDELAINYFAQRPGARVPNNSADMLRFLAELAEATGDANYLQQCAGLLTFLRRAQKSSGEFPYAAEGVVGNRGRPHFQCYQYNAFQCLGLIRYHELTGDPAPLPLIGGVLRFLGTGLGNDGHAFYDCSNHDRSVIYHTAVLGAAFAKASQLGLGHYGDLAIHAFAHLLRIQRPDGSLPYSRRDYRLLSDRRSYPRYLAMILYHLLLQATASEDDVLATELLSQCGS